jgi:hypothetical protein
VITRQGEGSAIASRTRVGSAELTPEFRSELQRCTRDGIDRALAVNCTFEHFSAALGDHGQELWRVSRGLGVVSRIGT